MAYRAGKYLAITAFPQAEIEPKEESEYIFIIDCSGSMSGNEIKLAKEALFLMVNSLPPEAYANIIAFGTTFKYLSERSLSLLNSKKQLESWIKSLKANLGGTVLRNPLEFAINSKPSLSTRRVIVLTDGCVFDPDEILQLIKDNNQTQTFSCLGIGYGVDAHLVKGIASQGGGECDFVLNGSDLRIKAMSLLNKTTLPKVTNFDFEIEDSHAFQYTPFPSLPPTYNSTSTFFIHTPEETFKSVLLKIDNEESVLQPLPISPIILQTLYGQSSIRELSFSPHNKELVESISLETGLLSDYTTLVGVGRKVREEDEPESFEIFVKTLTGRHINLRVWTNTFVEDLKEMIYKREGTEPERIKLIFAGRQMEDGFTLKNYSIKKDSTVHMVLMLRGGGSSDALIVTERISGENDEVSLVCKMMECHESNGLFRKDESVLKRIGIGIDLVEGVDESVKMTIALVAYMRKYLKDVEVVWRMAVRNALRALMKKDDKVDWEALIVKAMESI